MPFPKRTLLVAGTFLLSVLLYVDRVCISAAKADVVSELSLSDRQMGWVFAAFSLGYALFQTPAGYLSDRFGPRRVLASIVAIWSLFTGLTAAVWSFPAMLIVRFLFGAGEAGAFPGMSRAMYSWIPMRERGMVQGVNFSGSRIGAAITLPMVAWLIDQFGWRPTFAVLMMIGCVWAIAWFVFFRDDPDDASWLSDAEREHILQHRQSSSSDESDQDDDASSQGAASTSIYRSINVWMLSIQYFASNFIFFFGLTWFFPQLMTRYELSGLQASLFTAGPMVCGAIGNWTAGWLVDWMYRRGQWSWSRRLPAMIGFVLAAIGILGSITAQTPLSSSLWFCVCIFGADMTLSPSWSTCVDIGESRAGLVSGTMNMAGNVGSFVTSLAFPYLLQWTGSSQPFFFVAASLNFIAIAIWFRIDPTKPLDAAKS